MLNWQLLFAVVVADPGKKAIHPYWCQTKVRNQKLRVEAKPETLRRGPPSPPRFNVEMKGHLRPDIFKTKLRNSFSTFAHNVDSGGVRGGSSKALAFLTHNKNVQIQWIFQLRNFVRLLSELPSFCIVLPLQSHGFLAPSTRVIAYSSHPRVGLIPKSESQGL